MIDDPVSDAALASHARRMRPLRIAYAAVIAVVVAAALVTVKIAYVHGEISHVALHTVRSAPTSVTLAPPSATPVLAWSSTDRTAIGTPAYQGTVVTWDAHTVRGRDARTGTPTWSYTRTDRTVCTAMQDGGVTVAVYRLGGNCDELTAVNTGTGARLWTRTLDKDTAEFDGVATFSVQPGSFFFVSPTAVYSIASDGIDNFTFHHPGCRINDAVLGVDGALISQTCRGEQCNGAKFCGDGTQLLLRATSPDYNSDSSTNKNNPDQVIWNHIGNLDEPVVAGHTVAARSRDGATLQLYDPTTGRLLSNRPLEHTSSTAHADTTTLDADLVWLGGVTYAFRAGATGADWHAQTMSVPTVVAVPIAPALDVSTPAVVVSGGVALLDPTTGTVRSRYPISGIASGSLVYRFGSGFVVAGSSTRVFR